MPNPPKAIFHPPDEGAPELSRVEPTRTKGPIPGGDASMIYGWATREGPAVEARPLGDGVSVTLRGKLDVFATHKLGALFDALVASGYSSVVLELVDLESVEPAVLAAIITMTGRLVASGGSLTVRSSSGAFATFDLSWLSELVRSELACTC